MSDEYSIKEQSYLSDAFNCMCGRRHFATTKKVVVESHALKQIPRIVQELNYEKAFLVSDRHTFDAVTVDLIRYLKEANIPFHSYVFEDNILIPNENSVGKLIINYDPNCDILIAVGSGTINDLCKLASHKLQMNYFIVASAPSMDGFASIGAALISNNLKTTYSTHCPEVIIGDTAILAKAPQEMITAGVADILGKYTCLLDWKISHLINDEYWCPYIVAMVETSLKKVIENLNGIRNKDEKAIQILMEALVNTGIAMSFAGNSRPASGCEHHISHFWEMKFLFEHKSPILHGVKVGIGTLIASELYHKLAKTDLDTNKAREFVLNFNLDEWKETIRRTLLDASEEVILLEEIVQKNNAAKHEKRISKIESIWPSLVKTIEAQLPQRKLIEDMLLELGGVISPSDINLDNQAIYDAIIVAKEVRDRYSLLQLLWDLGLIHEFAQYAQTTFGQ